MSDTNFTIRPNVDLSGIEEANKASDRLIGKFRELNQRLGGTRIPTSLPGDLSKINDLTASYVERLRSEGKHLEANKAQIAGYKQSLAQLVTVQKGEEAKLEAIIQKTGASGKAFEEQAIKVNRASTAVNRMKNDIAQAERVMSKASGGATVFDAMKRKIRETSAEATHTHSIFKQVFSANLMTNAVTSVWGHIKNGISSVIGPAKEYAMAQQTMNATWLTLTGNAKKGQAMVDQINKMAINANNSTEMVDGLSQKFYAINKNAGETGKLTKSILTLQDAFGQSDDAVMNFGTQLSQAMANGKMSAQDMMSVVNVFPELRDRLTDYEKKVTHNSNLTTADVTKMMSQGKISAKDMIATINETAKAYGGATENFSKTIPGMMRTIRTQVPALLGEITKPLAKASNPLVGTLSNWVTAKSTKKEFDRVGQTFKKGLNASIEAFSGDISAKDVTKRLDGIVNFFNKAVKSGFSWLTAHAKDIKTFGSSVWDIAKTLSKQVWKDASNIFVNLGKSFGLISKDGKGSADPMHALAEATSTMAKHPKEVQTVAHAIVAISLAKGFGRVAGGMLNIGVNAYDSYKKITKLRNAMKDFSSGKTFSLLKGSMQSMRSASGTNFNGWRSLIPTAKNIKQGFGNIKTGFSNLSTAGKITTGLAGAGVAVSAVSDIYNGIKAKTKTGKFQGIGKGIGGAIGGGIGLWFGGPIGAMIGTKIGQTVGKWGGKAVLKFSKGWSAKKPPKNFWSIENLGWLSHDALSKMLKWGGNLVKSLTSGVKSYIDTFKKVWGGIFNWIGDKVNWYVNTVKKAWNKVAGWIGKGIDTVKGWFGGKKSVKKHATGGYITADHVALVGEEGPELAYQAKGGARLLGAYGPEIAKVKAGEKILTARQTSHAMNGGLGKGLKLHTYAKGTASAETKQGGETLGKLTKQTARSWTAIQQVTDRQSKKTKKSAIDSYTSMGKGVSKQMTSLKSAVIATANGTSKGFKGALGKMKSYAKGAMQDTIAQLNKGINGIDKVLSQFGGNAQVIKPVHFATGSNGKLDRDTLAVVNDATSGPRQEAIVRGSDVIFPSGNDRMLKLQKGDQVLNGTQTRQLRESWGLQHFATGSGVSNAELKKIAERGQKNPLGAFNNAFTVNVKVKQPEIQAGTTELAKNSADKFGKNWMQAMWKVINDAIGGDGAGRGGSREAFLKYAERSFSHIPYVMGAMSKLASDCSGMVAMALKHFGIDIGRTTVAMQESSGVQYLGKDIKKTVPGDLVIYGHGTGASGHVGIIKNPKAHTMFNETPPYSRVTSVDAPMSMGYGYYRVKGLSDGKQAKSKGGTALEALAKKQLGARAIKWIENHLGDEFGSAGSFKLGGDIADRARSLAKALRRLDPRATRNGISAILGNWQFESGLNPSAVNSSGGASGFGQWLGGRLANLKAYASKRGKSWNDPSLQLEFALKGDGSDSGIFRQILEGKGSVASLANAFSTRWERGGYNAQHVNGAMQVAKALGYANGGDPSVGKLALVGEKGPELVRFNLPGHVYSNEETNSKLSSLISNENIKKPKSLAHLLDTKLANTKKPQAKVTPSININLNGPIGSKKEAVDISGTIKAELAKFFEQIGYEFGADPSVY